MNEEILLRELDRLANSAVEAYLGEQGFVLYSGGIDSSILATLVYRKHLGRDWKLFTMGVKGSKDTESVRNERKSILPFSLMPGIVSEVDQELVINAAKETSRLVKVSNISHFEDCTAFYLICQGIRGTLGGKILLSANGPDELFCGYDRFRRIVDKDGYDAVNMEISRALDLSMLLCEQFKLIGSHFQLKTQSPFLDGDFARFCADEIPPELKISKGNDLIRKRLWRTYGRSLGLPEQVVLKPKKAMQYSMGIHSVVISLMKSGALSVENLLETIAK